MRKISERIRPDNPHEFFSEWAKEMERKFSREVMLKTLDQLHACKSFRLFRWSRCVCMPDYSEPYCKYHTKRHFNWIEEQQVQREIDLGIHFLEENKLVFD